MYSVRAALSPLYFILVSQLFSIDVPVTGQIPFNALVALHLFLGYSLHSPQNGGHGWAWDSSLAYFHCVKSRVLSSSAVLFFCCILLTKA